MREPGVVRQRDGKREHLVGDPVLGRHTAPHDRSALVGGDLRGGAKRDANLRREVRAWRARPHQAEAAKRGEVWYGSDSHEDDGKLARGCPAHRLNCRKRWVHRESASGENGTILRVGRIPVRIEYERLAVVKGRQVGS